MRDIVTANLGLGAMNAVVRFVLLGVLLVGAWGCEERGAPRVENGLGKETDMAVELQWLGHASFRISSGDTVVYIDPWKLKSAQQDASLVLVSHGHFDHYSAEDIAKLAGPETKLVGSGDVVEQQGEGDVLKPGQSVTIGDVTVTGVAAYNPNKDFHPKANEWLGFVVGIGGVRIYYAGDTDVTDEMKRLSDIDLALLPVGGTYTMDAEEAAEVAGEFKPVRAVPYHWGDIVGGVGDAEKFAEAAGCEVTVLQPGGSIEVGGG